MLFGRYKMLSAATGALSDPIDTCSATLYSADHTHTRHRTCANTRALLHRSCVYAFLSRIKAHVLCSGWQSLSFSTCRSHPASQIRSKRKEGRTPGFKSRCTATFMQLLQHICQRFRHCDDLKAAALLRTPLVQRHATLKRKEWRKDVPGAATMAAIFIVAGIEQLRQHSGDNGVAI